MKEQERRIGCGRSAHADAAGRWRLRGLPVLLCVLLCLSAATVRLPAQTLSKYDLEAAYLYDFGKLVHWPADLPADSGNAGTAPKTFDICVLGQDPFGATLERLIRHDEIDGRPIRERRIASAPEAAGCAIVYISSSEESNVHRILAALAGKGGLLVSDLPHFVEEGGMIQFVLQQNRVRFSVNLTATLHSHLTLSSELLKVAMDVVDKPESGATP